LAGGLAQDIFGSNGSIRGGIGDFGLLNNQVVRPQPGPARQVAGSLDGGTEDPNPQGNADREGRFGTARNDLGIPPETLSFWGLK